MIKYSRDNGSHGMLPKFMRVMTFIIKMDYRV